MKNDDEKIEENELDKLVLVKVWLPKWVVDIARSAAKDERVPLSTWFRVKLVHMMM